MAHDCKYEETMGRIKEFMDNIKGLKTTLFTIALAILLQVGTFLYLWGGLTTTVKSHEKSISAICDKLNTVRIVEIAHADENSE